LEAPTIGGITLTWEMVLGEREPGCLLSDLLAAGLPVGEAVATALSDPQARLFEDRTCVLGDPRTRAVPTRRREPSRRRSTPSSRPSSTRRPADDRRLQFLEASLRAALDLPKPPFDRLARRALAAARRYGRAHRAEISLEGSDSAPGPQLRQTMLHYLLRRIDFVEDWLQFGRFVAATRPGQCPHCGHDVKRFMAVFPRRGYVERALDTCVNCAVIREAQSDVDLAVSVEDGQTIRLHGRLPRARWTAAVLVSSRRQDRIYSWPARPDGSAAERFEPPCGLPERGVYVLVYVVCELSVTMLRCYAFGSGTVDAFLAAPSPFEQQLARVEQALATNPGLDVRRR
jgi:hypothetical protein